MEQMGHTDPKLALRVYARVMRQDEDKRARLRALVEGFDLAEKAEIRFRAVCGY